MSDWLEIHALADGELGADEKAAAEARLKTCEKSRAEYESVQLVKSVLHSKIESETCSRTWSKCQGRIRELEQRHRVERFVTRNAWGLCGGIFCLLVGVAWMNRQGGNEMHTGDVARMVAGVGPASREVRNAPESLQELIPANRRTPTRVKFGSLRVYGSGQGMYRGNPYAVFGVTDQGQYLDLIVLDGVVHVAGLEPLAENPKYTWGKLGQRSCVSWNDEDYTLILLGDLPSTNLAASAEQVDLEPENQ